MAASPKYKIFDADGRYQASTREVEAAAALMAFYGDGAQIRTDHSARWTVWTEGAEAQPAAESYDLVAEHVYQRERELPLEVAKDLRRRQRVATR